MKKTPKNTSADKVRLTLDTELIADLETDGESIKGGASSGGIPTQPPQGSVSGGGGGGTIAIAGGGRTRELNGGC